MTQNPPPPSADIPALVREIPLTQGKVALVDEEDFEFLSQWKWYVSVFANNQYARRAIWDSGKERAISISMHGEIMKTPKGMVCDHIDGNGLNNCRHNLRICTKEENWRNRRSKKGSSSKYLGVYKVKGCNKWGAIIKGQRLGYFADEKQAAVVYDKAALKQYGEYAHLNFPVHSYPPLPEYE